MIDLARFRCVGTRALGLAYAVALAGLLVQGGAAAQAPPRGAIEKPLAETLHGEARSAYDAAKLLYADENYVGAMAKFQQAYDLEHDHRLLWNMAACAKKLHRYVRVIELVDRYVDEGGDRLSERDRREASEFRTAVLEFVGSVAITTDEGVQVLVDGTETTVDATAKPLRLDMGTHRLEFRRPGFVSQTRTVNVTGGRDQTLEVRLKAEPRDGRLVVAAPADATIVLDGRVVGGSDFQGAVKAGSHELVVSAPHRLTYRHSIEVGAGATKNMHIVLEPEAKAVPTWVWVGGAAVLVAGAAVGGYFLFKPDDKAAPPPVQGTIGAYEIPNAWRFR